MIIREAISQDVSELALLMGQLGYPTSIEEMQVRMDNIQLNSNYHTLVVEFEGSIVGMAGVSIGYFYELDGSYARILAFVVDSNYRKKGIGANLIHKAEEWARKQGATSIVLNSGTRPERFAAHQFYKNVGYEERSIGFAKKLI